MRSQDCNIRVLRMIHLCCCAYSEQQMRRLAMPCGVFVLDRCSDTMQGGKRQCYVLLFVSPAGLRFHDL